MKAKDAKMLFQAGAITDVRVVRAPMEDGWIVLFCTQQGYQPLEKFRGNIRIVRTLDGAAKVVESIGFNSFTVHATHSSVPLV